LQNIDKRIIRVTIDVDGQTKTYSDLGIVVRGQKVANSTENTCEVKISNLTAETRNYLLTETSPFNKDRKRKKIIIEAGRESFGTSKVFSGDIISASPSQPPDIGLTLKAQTGAFFKGKLVANTGKDLQKASEIAKLVAADTETTLDFDADDFMVTNYAYTGGALGQMDKLGDYQRVAAFIDDDVLVVTNAGKARQGRTRVLRADTGMIGIPEVSERGVKVKFLFDTETALGGQLSIESKLNPALNGNYLIYKLAFELATRDTPFYWAAEATRL